MRVLIALESASSSEEIFETTMGTFGHFESITFLVAYPEDAVTCRPEEFEEIIDEWRASLNHPAQIESIPLSGSKPYADLLLDTIADDTDIDHLIISPHKHSPVQRLFGDAPSPMFVECPVPITVSHESEEA